MKIYYVYDPLCVFCYGFSPLIHKLYKKYSDRIDFELLPGGLWIDDNVKHVTPQVAANLRKASEKVSNMSGKAFGEAFYKLLDTDHVFDSFAGSKAMATITDMKLKDPFDYLNLIYESTFINGKDSNDINEYSKAAETLNMNSDLFTSSYLDEEMIEKTYSLIKKAKELGVKSFPTVLVEKNNEYYSYPINYSSFSALENWLLEVRG